MPKTSESREHSEDHNPAHKLLMSYRHTMWMKSVLESTLSLENESRSGCSQAVRFTDDIVESLKEHGSLGEKMYRIIKATYMTSKQPECTEDILRDLAKNYKPISRRTYYRLRSQAIKLVNDELCSRNIESC